MTSDITTALEGVANQVAIHDRDIAELKKLFHSSNGVGCKILSEGDNCQCAKCYTDRNVSELWNEISDIRADIREAAKANAQADPQVGVCTICNCAIWQHQARVNDDHQVCQLIRRAEIAEKALEEERENRLKSADQDKADLKALRDGEVVYFTGLGLRSLNVPDRILEQELQDYKKQNEDLKEEVEDHARNATELAEQLGEQQEKYEKLASDFGEMALHYREVERKAKMLDQLVRQEKVDVKGNGKQWVLVGWAGRYDDVLKERDKYKELYENLLKEYTEVQMEILRLSQRINGQ